MGLRPRARHELRYELELGVIANIESWENDFEYEYGLRSFLYLYSLLMLTSSNICIEVRDDVDVDPEDDEPDELPPLPGHVNREGSRLRNKIKETLFGN